MARVGLHIGEIIFGVLHSSSGCLFQALCGRSWLFFSILLFQWSIFYFSLPEALRRCSFHPSSRFVKDHVLFMPIHLTGVLCPFAQVLFALSSLASHFYRSAVRICSSLFLFSNGVFSTSSIFVVFFFKFVQPRKVLWFHSFVKEAT